MRINKVKIPIEQLSAINIYRLSIDPDYESIWRKKIDIASMETWELTERSEVADYWDSNASLIMEGRPDPMIGILPSSYLHYVYSDRARQAIEKLDCTGIQFFPINVRHDILNDIGVFWYGHVNLLAGALDKERSAHFISNVMGEIIYNLVQPVIIGSVAAQKDFFRFAESEPGIYVSERVRELCVREGFTNMKFTKQKVI
jgi:hypothetical protein